MSQLDDEILESVSEEPPPPRLPTPPLPQRSNLEDSLGEIPPDIPRRTTARLELLDEPVVVGDKKTDKVHVAEQAGFSGTYDVVGGGTSDGVYEHPLPSEFCMWVCMYVHSCLFVCLGVCACMSIYV